MKHTHFFLSAIISLSILLAGCALLPGAAPQTTQAIVPVAEQTSGVIVEGHVTPRDHANLFFTSGGEVVEILVKEGETVTQGQVLARLGDRESFEAQVAAAELEVANAQQVLDDLNTHATLAYAQAALEVTAVQSTAIEASKKLDEIGTDDYQKKIDDARVKANNAKDDLKNAQDEFDKYKDSDPDNTDRQRAKDALTKAQNDYNTAVRERDTLVNDLDKAKADDALAKARLDDAIRRRDARKDGPDPDDLALAEARLKNANAQLTAAQAALNKRELIAPFSGTIVKVDITAGEQAVPNQPVMVLVDFSAWYVETSDLTENEVVKIKVGQTVTIKPDALPEVSLTGMVESINDAYTEQAGDIIYKTKILLKDPDPLLRWGMTVEVVFEEGK